MDDLNSAKVRMPTVSRELARDFHPIYSSLLALMSVQGSKETDDSQAPSSSIPSSSVTTTTVGTVTTRKRPPTSPGTSGVAKRPKVSESIVSETQSSERKAADSPGHDSEPKTPEQPTHPRDSKWSGATNTSQDEDNTKILLSRLLSHSLAQLAPECTTLSWQQSGHIVELHDTYML